MHRLPSVEGVVSAVLLAAAIALLGVMAMVLFTGSGGVWSYFTADGQLYFGGWAILIFASSYALVLYPIYRGRAVWVFGLSVGAVELTGVVESLIMWGTSNQPVANLEWLVYIALLSLFFADSLVATWGHLKLDAPSIVMIATFIAMGPLAPHIFPVQHLYGNRVLVKVPSWYTPLYDILGIVASFWVAKGMRVWPGQESMAHHDGAGVGSREGAVPQGGSPSGMTT